jgi:TatD DNase family protein
MLINNKKIIAIGETGLDYYHAPFDIQKQKEFLFMHIKLAKKYSLPLVLHVRDSGNNYAHNDVVQIVKEKCNGLKVLIHCFDANKDIAKQYVDLGCYIAFGGKITMKNDYLAESLNIIPENKILSETDAPFLTPLNFKINKSSFNKPIYMLETINKINEIKDKNLTDIMFENSCKLFNIKNI